MLKIFYKTIFDFQYLFSSPHKSIIKFRLLFKLLAINFKYLFLDPIFKLKKEKLFGFKVEAFSYEAIRYLFQEVFYRNEYFFIADNEEPIIFDCGANIGFATLFFKWLYPKSTVYAFEPDEKTFLLLKKNVESNNLQNVFLFNKAISKENSLIEFYVDEEEPGSMMMSTIANRLEGQKVEVEAIALSSFLDEIEHTQIDFVKMDIEGSEEEAMDDLITNNRLNRFDRIVIEYHHKIENKKAALGKFLLALEEEGFEYQLDTSYKPLNCTEVFQDILIYCFKPNSKGHIPN